MGAGGEVGGLGEDATSYTRKQEERHAKKSDAKQKIYRKGRVACIYVSLLALPRARGARRYPTYGPLFQPLCASALSHTAKIQLPMRIRARVRV